MSQRFKEYERFRKALYPNLAGPLPVEFFIVRQRGATQTHESPTALLITVLPCNPHKYFNIQT